MFLSFRSTFALVLFLSFLSSRSTYSGLDFIVRICVLPEEEEEEKEEEEEEEEEIFLFLFIEGV